MESFVEKRLSICEQCPIVRRDPNGGLICDSRKYISPDGSKGSLFPKEGGKRGCGCNISRGKAQNVNAHCIIGKG